MIIKFISELFDDSLLTSKAKDGNICDEFCIGSFLSFAVVNLDSLETGFIEMHVDLGHEDKSVKTIVCELDDYKDLLTLISIYKDLSTPELIKEKAPKITWETINNLPEDEYGDKIIEIDNLDDIDPALALNYLLPFQPNFQEH